MLTFAIFRYFHINFISIAELIESNSLILFRTLSVKLNKPYRIMVAKIYEMDELEYIKEFICTKN